MKRKANILAIALCALIAAVSNASAEIPKKTKQALQDQAPEKVQIEVQNVEKKRKLGGGFDLDIKAKVISVKKSDTGLEVGDTLRIRYWIHNPKKRVPSGSYPTELKKGKTYMVYLELSAKDKKVYSPAAASGSFEARAASKKS